MIHVNVGKIPLKKSWIATPCPLCKTPNSLHITVYHQFVGFIVPLFPLKKTCMADCSSCKGNVEIQYMSPDFYVLYQQLKKDSRTPRRLYIGSLILVIGMVLLCFYFYENSKRVNSIIKLPQKNDLFEIVQPSGNYTLYKVARVKGDTVLFSVNKYEVTENESINDLYEKFGKDFDNHKTMVLTKLQLLQMHSRGEVFDAQRGSNH